jgi:glycosyltransferase involved in cell wall biosynthesis
VIVVDDGSRDGSARCAREAGATVLRHERRRGKGAAIRTGIARALDGSPPADAVLLLDGDGQHLPEEIPRLVERFAAGARFVAGDRSAELGRMSLLRRLTNRAMTWTLNVLFLARAARLGDSQCGFRLLAADLCRALALRADHFEVESEILVCAHRLGEAIVTVPVSVAPRHDASRPGSRSRSKIRPLPDTVRFLWLLARLSVSPLRRPRTRPASRFATRAGDAHGRA